MDRMTRLAAALAVGVFVALSGGAAQAELRIDINQGHLRPTPIATPIFSNGGAALRGTNCEGQPVQARVDQSQADAKEVEFGKNITSVMSADLERSGLFALIDPRSYLDKVAPMDVRPKFDNWKVLNAEALVHGRAILLNNGQLRVEFRLWDVVQQSQMTGQALCAQPGDWRRIAHKIADAVYHRLTGEAGYFDTRIVYIAESGPATDRIKRLAIMDQDGANHKILTPGEGHSKMILTPRFSPTAGEITYLSYYRGVPRVYLFNIETGRQERLGDFPGMTYAPRFSPDGNQVIMSMAQDGNSEIYVMDLRTRRTARLTRHPAIDTSPSFAPDGKQITFNSDRGGSQQIYVMNSDGSDVRRISFGDGRYGTPVWSPRGDLIAFTKMKSGTFYIGVMRPDGSGERLLSEGYLVEAPTWAPNGRVLMFFRQTTPGGGRKDSTRLSTIDLTGYNERTVITPQDASDPAWSGLID